MTWGNYLKQIHESLGRLNFVITNPLFPYGVPKNNNVNSLLLQYFARSMNDDCKAGFIMASLAGDARGSYREFRYYSIQSGVLDVMFPLIRTSPTP